MLPFPKLMLTVFTSKPTVTHCGLGTVLEADLGTPSVSLPSVFIFCWFYKERMTRANSASQAKSCNFIRGGAGLGSQVTALHSGDRVSVVLHWAVVASRDSLVGPWQQGNRRWCKMAGDLTPFRFNLFRTTQQGGGSRWRLARETAEKKPPSMFQYPRQPFSTC